MIWGYSNGFFSIQYVYCLRSFCNWILNNELTPCFFSFWKERPEKPNLAVAYFNSLRFPAWYFSFVACAFFLDLWWRLIPAAILIFHKMPFLSWERAISIREERKYQRGSANLQKLYLNSPIIMIKISNWPISDQGGNFLRSSSTVCFQAWFAFDNDTFFMADDHLLSKEKSCQRIDGRWV